MKLQIALGTRDIKAIVRQEVARRFPSYQIEALYMPHLDHDVTLALDDDPSLAPPSVVPPTATEPPC